MRPLTPVEAYRRASAWTTTQALRALELGADEDTVEAVLDGCSAPGESMLALMFAVDRLNRVAQRSREVGLGDHELALLSQDAAAPIREEWSFGVPTDVLYPGLA